MNRRGDVPVAMLAVIALGLVIYAGFAFATLYKGFGSVSTDYSELISRASINENYIRSLSENAANVSIHRENSTGNLRAFFMEEVEKRNIPKIGGLGNYFGKVRNGNFTFEEREGRYYLEINGLFVQSEYKNSKITRNFNISRFIS